MCGIAGFVIAPGDLGKINTAMMTLALGYEMKSRGTDATGIYTVDSRGRWKLRKSPNPADVFLAYRYGIGTNAKTLMLHTRAATQGKASNPDNNHPIHYGGIVGIHNGIVWNDDALFKHYDWKRNAEVDSEAIFAALNNMDQKEALENIDGSWAIAWADTDIDPNRLYLCRGSSSSLHYATTKEGSVMFASTSNAVKEGFKYGGVTGDPDVQMAPEGFLAYIDPDGGLVQLDSPDTTGDKAIGKKVRTAGYSHGGYHNGTSWDESWRPYGGGTVVTNQQSYVRTMLTGEKVKPNVGDFRKYLNNAGTTEYEVCTRADAVVTSWMPVKSPHQIELCHILDPDFHEAVVLPFDGTTSAASDVSGDDQRRLWGDGHEDDEFLDILGTETPGLDAEIRYGFAEKGDIILIDKHLIHGGEGSLCAEVLYVDESDRTITVQFREARIKRTAQFEVAYRKGVTV